MAKANKDKQAELNQPDLSKLKKREILEIMLAQGEEIDRLRARITEIETERDAKVAELEAKLENKELSIKEVGSIAEASLKVTKIFEEAEKAAVVYLENIMKRYE